MPDMQMIPLEQIIAGKNQPRQTFYEESLQELAQSIKERGVLEPIVVRPTADGRYEIVMGERRYRAAQMAGLTEIPAIVRELSDEEAAADALLENFQREDLNPIERAQAIQKLLTMMSWEQVARTLGVSESTLRRHLELLELPQVIQQELMKPSSVNGNGGAFTEGHARALLPLNKEVSTQLRLVEKVRNEKLSIGDLEKIVNAIQEYPNKKEAFLRVPLHVTEEMLKHLGAHRERQRPYKPQTADQHLKNLQKACSAVSDLLDERVIEFINTQQMNQLLATTGELQHELEQFNQRVRTALQNKEYGFREVYIHCPLCGRVELIGSLRCSVCWTVLRRCYDCGNYDRTYERCAVTNAQIFISEAENPKEYSKSYKCPDYKPKFEVLARKPQPKAA
ncbi:Chromosome-partitioning protein Spo0J [bacterium HR16]|nr:Chromosome-partitioning protein Spo0J [bacterium HR16]